MWPPCPLHTKAWSITAPSFRGLPTQGLPVWPMGAPGRGPGVHCDAGGCRVTARRSRRVLMECTAPDRLYSALQGPHAHTPTAHQGWPSIKTPETHTSYPSVVVNQRPHRYGHPAPGPRRHSQQPQSPPHIAVTRVLPQTYSHTRQDAGALEAWPGGLTAPRAATADERSACMDGRGGAAPAGHVPREPHMHALQPPPWYQTVEYRATAA